MKCRGKYSQRPVCTITAQYTKHVNIMTRIEQKEELIYYNHRLEIAADVAHRNCAFFKKEDFYWFQDFEGS